MGEKMNQKILKIDLSTGKIEKEQISHEISKNFIGGRGIGTYLINSMVNKKISPFSEENPLIFATGPLTGSAAPTSGRYMVLCISPLTNFIACSNSGGKFGAELKKTGFDYLCFTGKAKRPVCVVLNDENVEIKNAEDLWGKDTHETTDILMQNSGLQNPRIACIGPAGENLVRFACVINDKHRAAGRSGVGAVMGSKNLKAIVVKGSKRNHAGDKERFMETVRAKVEKLNAHPVTGEALPKLGTKVLDNIINEHGAYPTRNFQTGIFEGTGEISGEALIEKKYLKKNKGCYGCPIKCGRVTELPAKNRGEGPEYESGWAFGAATGVKDLIAITEANYLCNLYGLDTISAGVTIACAMELYEKGFIKKSDLNSGPSLNFGSSESIVYYTRDLSFREGLGDKLAEGSLRLSREFGAPELSMSVKGQELPAYDPRGVQGQALAYATSNRGGCHVRAYLIAPEVLGIPEKLDPQQIRDKAQWVKAFQDLTAVIDSMGLCLFTSFALGAGDYLELLNDFTGNGYSMDEMLECGERIWNLERRLNIKLGLTKEMDTLPERLLKDALLEGNQKGHVARLDEMLPEYYEIRGWDENGIPRADKLRELGL